MESSTDAGAILRGAVVQRADVGGRGAVLKVRQPGVTWFVVAVAGRGVGLVGARPARPEGARPLGKLEGFRVVWITDGDLGLERGEVRALIQIGRAHIDVHVGPEAWSEVVEDGAGSANDLEAWLAKGAAIAGDAAREALALHRIGALRALKRGAQRLTRRADAVKGDLARIGDAEALANQAQWLVAEASRAPRGARSLRVTDWSTGEPRVVEVPLDPSKPARAQIDAMFQRARRLKVGAKIAGERLAQAEAALAALAPLAEHITRAEDVAAIDAALALARAAAPKDVKVETAGPSAGAPGRAQSATRSPPFRTFHARNGARVLVGRGAVHNDTLTFQIARPHDLWLHVKGLPGAHVIVPLPKNQSCPGDLLADAAHLAAHFSDARDEAVVDVQYVPRRHLRKPRGSPPGLVVVEREKVIAVRIEPLVLRALLESEEA